MQGQIRPNPTTRSLLGTPSSGPDVAPPSSFLSPHSCSSPAIASAAPNPATGSGFSPDTQEIRKCPSRSPCARRARRSLLRPTTLRHLRPICRSGLASNSSESSSESTLCLSKYVAVYISRPAGLCHALRRRLRLLLNLNLDLNLARYPALNRASFQKPSGKPNPALFRQLYGFTYRQLSNLVNLAPYRET